MQIALCSATDNDVGPWALPRWQTGSGPATAEIDVIDVPRAHRDLVGLTVLAFLAEQPRHPYEMQRLVRQRRKDFVIGLPRSLYHAVDRLVRTGLIEPAETSRAGKRPERTRYRITEEGRAELAAWLAELISIPVPGDPLFAAALSYLTRLPPAAALHALQARAAVLEGEVVTADAQVRELGALLPRVHLLEIEHGRAVRQAELAWLRSLIEDVRVGNLTWQPPAEATPPHRPLDPLDRPDPEPDAESPALRIVEG
jgi:DNA-binding PadR family transcriptional regulator